MPVPMRPHNPAGQVQLDVVNAVLYLLADGLNEPIRAVTFPGMARGEEVAAGGGEEVAASVHRRTRRPGGRLEGPLPGHVHEVARPGAAHRRHSSLGQPPQEVLPEPCGKLGDAGSRRIGILRVDVDVPQARQQIGALQVNDLIVPDLGCRLRLTAGLHGADAACVHRYGCIGPHDLRDAVYDVAIG